MTRNRKFREKRQRERLYQEQNSRCYWCGVVMVKDTCHDKKEVPGNIATLDHLFSRLSPERGQVIGRTHVLACLECNNRRARLEEKMLPKEVLWERSGNYPR